MDFRWFRNIARCEESKKVSDLPVPDFSTMPPEGELPALVQQAQAQEVDRTKFTNPGTYEQIQNDVKRILTADVFDGLRAEIVKSQSEKFATTHSFLLGSAMAPGGMYQFGANAVVGDAKDPNTLLISRISPDGRLNAQWIQKISSAATLRAQSQLSHDPNTNAATADLDFKQDDYSLGFKFSPGPLVGASYLQRVTKELCMGGEGYYHAVHNRALLSYCTKYTGPDWTAIGTYAGVGVIQLHYMKKLKERATFASELTYNTASGESTANVGAEMVFRQSRLLTTVDQSGKIATTLEAMLGPQMTILLSAEMQHSADDYKFGYGVRIG